MQIEEHAGPSTAREVALLIRNRIKPVLGALASCRSTRELVTRPEYRAIEQELQTVLDSVHEGDFAPAGPRPKDWYRIVAWNIERGKQLEGQIEVLREHEYLRGADVLLLTETDVGMARSGNIDVARTMASALGMNYVFAPCYLSLVKGSGVERDVTGDNDLGLHGNAILSRYPIRNARRIRLENGIDKMAGNEKRLGQQAALAATVEFPGQALPLACVHLCANSTQRHRAAQMRAVLDALPPDGPALVGGDWNTTTFDSSSATRAILGYCRRVLMGPGNVIRNHFLHPYRWFERRLFGLLESRGFDFRNCNRLGESTIFYNVDDIRAHKGLAEWVPNWCFAFIRWALREHGGGCPLQIDWFATRGLRCRNPVVVHEVGHNRSTPLSDHDPIGVEIALP